jgi:hypothetical protein
MSSFSPCVCIVFLLMGSWERGDLVQSKDVLEKFKRFLKEIS